MFVDLLKVTMYGIIFIQLTVCLCVCAPACVRACVGRRVCENVLVCAYVCGVFVHLSVCVHAFMCV